MTILDMIEFGNYWNQETKSEDGQINFRNVEIIWQIESENCLEDDGVYTESDDGLEFSVMIDFEILIHK